MGATVIALYRRHARRTRSTAQGVLQVSDPRTRTKPRRRAPEGESDQRGQQRNHAIFSKGCGDIPKSHALWNDRGVRDVTIKLRAYCALVLLCFKTDSHVFVPSFVVRRPSFPSNHTGPV